MSQPSGFLSLKNGRNVTRCFREENIFLSTLGEFPSLETEGEREREGGRGGGR